MEEPKFTVHSLHKSSEMVESTSDLQNSSRDSPIEDRAAGFRYASDSQNTTTDPLEKLPYKPIPSVWDDASKLCLFVHLFELFFSSVQLF